MQQQRTFQRTATGRLKGRITPARGDQYGAHICKKRTHTQINEHMERWDTVDEFTEFVCVCRRCQERKIGERDGESDSMARRERKKKKNLVI